MNITTYDFETMRGMDIRNINPSEIIDINCVIINSNLSKEERIIDFIKQIKNPYLYKCGKALVKVTFADTEETLEDKLKSYLLSMQ